MQPLRRLGVVGPQSGVCASCGSSDCPEKRCKCGGFEGTHLARHAIHLSKQTISGHWVWASARSSLKIVPDSWLRPGLAVLGLFLLKCRCLYAVLKPRFEGSR